MSDTTDRAQKAASAAQAAAAAAQAAAAYQMKRVADEQREANELARLKFQEEEKEKERRAKAKELRIACLESSEQLEQLERLISSEADEKALFEAALLPSVHIPLVLQMGREVFEEFEDLERLKGLTSFLKRLDISLGGARVNLLDLPERVKAYTQPFYKAADDFLSRCEDIESLSKKNSNISLDAPEIWTDKIPDLEQSALRLFEETEKVKALGLLITEDGITKILAPAKTLLAQEGDRPVLNQLKKKKFSLEFPEKSLGAILSSIKTDFDELTQETATAKQDYLALAKQAKIAATDEDKEAVKVILGKMGCLEKSFADVEDEVFARKWLKSKWWSFGKKGKRLDGKWPVWKKILVGFGVFLGCSIIATVIFPPEIAPEEVQRLSKVEADWGSIDQPLSEADANGQNIDTFSQPGSASAPSFDCQKASTWIEKEICSNDLLGRLDDAMNKNYQGSLGTNIGKEALQDLRATQRKWITERNRCTTAACIEEKYRARIDALCEYPAISGVNWGCTVSSEDVH